MKNIIIALMVLLAVPFTVFALEDPEMPECLEGFYYEGELIEGEWKGECVADEPIIEPVEEAKDGGTSFINFLSRVAWARFDNGIVDWLTTKFTIGRVVCSTESHPFALNDYGQPTDGNTILDLGMNHGYEILINGDEGFWTYHRFEMPDWMSGIYYCRTISQTLIDTLTGNELVSQEFQIEL